MPWTDSWKAVDSVKHSWITNSQYSWKYILEPKVPKGTDMEKDIMECVKSHELQLSGLLCHCPQEKCNTDMFNTSQKIQFSQKLVQIIQGGEMVSLRHRIGKQLKRHVTLPCHFLWQGRIIIYSVPKYFPGFF